MDGRRFDAWARAVKHVSASRRHLTAGLLGATMTFASAAQTGDEALAKKKRRKKKVKCPTGETRCPKGFPSSCCAADTTCCDTSRLGCCVV